MFWRSLPWDFRTVMAKVSKHASSEITLATGTAVTHSWAVHWEKGFLALPDTKSYPPHGTTKQLGYELYVGFTSIKILLSWRCNNVMAEFTLHDKTERLPEWIHIHYECLRKQSGSWHILAPNLMLYPLYKEILCFSDRITQAFLGSFRPFWGVLSQIDFLTWKKRIRGLKPVKGFKHSQWKC